MASVMTSFCWIFKNFQMTKTDFWLYQSSKFLVLNDEGNYDLKHTKGNWPYINLDVLVKKFKSYKYLTLEF